MKMLFILFASLCLGTWIYQNDLHKITVFDRLEYVGSFEVNAEGYDKGLLGQKVTTSRLLGLNLSAYTERYVIIDTLNPLDFVVLAPRDVERMQSIGAIPAFLPVMPQLSVAAFLRGHMLWVIVASVGAVLWLLSGRAKYRKARRLQASFSRHSNTA